MKGAEYAQPTIRNFLDGMNHILAKDGREALTKATFQIKAELLPERHGYGKSCLWLVLDNEGRSMYWMVPEELASRFKTGDVVIASGFPVLWPSTKQGKRLEWLQVKEASLAHGEISRQRHAKKLAAQGLLGRYKPKDWPIAESKGSVKVHLVLGEKNDDGEHLRELLLRGRRFNVFLHRTQINDPQNLSQAIGKVAGLGGDFLILLQQEDDNPLVFDHPSVLQSLKNNPCYTYLIQPKGKAKPYGVWRVEQWSEDPYQAVREILARCWAIWKGPKDKDRLREAVVLQAEKDRTRFASELSRLRRQNKDLQELANKANPGRLAEFEAELNSLSQQLEREAHRQKAALEQLFQLEKERDELIRKLALAEAGGVISQEKTDVEVEIQKVRREEELKRLLLQGELERLQEAHEKLESRVKEASPIMLEEMQSQKTVLEQELGRSEERREQLSELLFLLEQENRELKGRLNFREDLEQGIPSEQQDQQGKALSDDEVLVLGRARLMDEIRDLLIKEEMERLQRENRQLKHRLSSCSPEMIVELKHQLAAVRSDWEQTEQLNGELNRERIELRRQVEELKRELFHYANEEMPPDYAAEGEPNIQLDDQHEPNEYDGKDDFIDRTFKMFRQGLKWGKR